MHKSMPQRYHFPARDRAEEIPGRILRLARRAKTLTKAELTRELYQCAAAAQEHVLGMSTRLTAQERIAERHQWEVDDARREGVRGFAAALFCEGDVFDPNGYFVYLLWGSNPDTPLYVGRSTNVFARVGAHMNNRRRRGSVRGVQFLRCANATVMAELEWTLILKFQPPWNVLGIVGRLTAG